MPNQADLGLKDSKLLTALQRERLYEEIEGHRLGGGLHRACRSAMHSACMSPM